MNASSFRKPTKIHPSQTVKLSNNGESIQTSFQTWLNYLWQFIRGLLLALVISIVASFAGFLTLRLLKMPTAISSAKAVMDEIFRQAAPPFEQIVAVLVVSFIFASIFYGQRLIDKEKRKEYPGWFTYFLAGICVVAALDLILFNVTLHQLWNDQLQVYGRIRETITAQGVSLGVIVLLIPLFSALIHIETFPTVQMPALPSKLLSILNWIRFFTVACILLWGCVYFATNGIKGFENQRIRNYLPFLQGFNITLNEAGALLMAISMVVLIFWSPKVRQMQRFWLVRIILFVACLVGICLIYVGTPVGETYLESILFAILCASMTAPIFKVIS